MWVFSQRTEDGIFHRWRQMGQAGAQAGRRLMQVLSQEGHKRTMKRGFAVEPFIDDYTEGVLIASRTRLVLDLLRCHVEGRACHFLFRERGQGVLHYRNAKVAEHDLTPGIE